jgi:uncharacterized protein (DUF3084 family)
VSVENICFLCMYSDMKNGKVAMDDISIEHERLKAKSKNLSGDLNGLKNQANKMDDDLSADRQEIARLEAELARKKQNLLKKESERDSLEAQVQRAQKQANVSMSNNYLCIECDNRSPTSIV